MRHSPEHPKKQKTKKIFWRCNVKRQVKGKVMASRCESVVDLSTLFSGWLFFLFFLPFLFFFGKRSRPCIGPLIARPSNTFRAPTDEERRFVDGRISKFPPRTKLKWRNAENFQVFRQQQPIEHEFILHEWYAAYTKQMGKRLRQRQLPPDSSRRNFPWPNGNCAWDGHVTL